MATALGYRKHRLLCYKLHIKALPNLQICPYDLVSSTSFFMARFALLALLSVVHAVLGASIPKRVSNGDFFNPAQAGGSWLDSGSGSLGEPLNVKHSP